MPKVELSYSTNWHLPLNLKEEGCQGDLGWNPCTLQSRKALTLGGPGMLCWGCLMDSSVPIHLCHDERVAAEVGKWVGWDFRVVVCNCGGDWGPSALSLHFRGV